METGWLTNEAKKKLGVDISVNWYRGELAEDDFCYSCQRVIRKGEEILEEEFAGPWCQDCAKL